MVPTVDIEFTGKSASLLAPKSHARSQPVACRGRLRRRAGIQRFSVLLFVALPLVAVQSQYTRDGSDISEKIVSMNGHLKDEVVKTSVNKHAVLNVHVTINCTSKPTIEAIESDTKWSVVLDELVGSDSTEVVHVVQTIHLDWSSSPHQGVAELSFVVPASVSRSFLLSLLEDERLVTRRLANVHATKKLESRGGGRPVVSVHLEGTAQLRSAELGQTNRSISSQSKLVAFLLFSIWIFRSLLVASSARLFSANPPPCRQDEDVGYDDDGIGPDDSDHSTDLLFDDDEMTDYPGYDGSVSSGASRRLCFSHLADHSNDDESMMPPTVFRFKVDPSRFDHLTLPPCLGPRLDIFQGQHFSNMLEHREKITPSFEDRSDVEPLENDVSRNVATPLQQDDVLQHRGNYPTRQCTAVEFLPFTEPIPKSRAACKSKNGSFAAQELTHAATSLHQPEQSQVWNGNGTASSVSSALIPGTLSSTSSQHAKAVSAQESLLTTASASGRDAKDETFEACAVRGSIQGISVIPEASINSVVVPRPDATTKGTCDGSHNEINHGAAVHDAFPDNGMNEISIPEPVRRDRIVASCGDGSRSSQLTDPGKEAVARCSLSVTTLAVMDIDEVDTNQVDTELSSEEIENSIVSRSVGLDTSKTLVASDESPIHLKPNQIALKEAANSTLPYLISPAPRLQKKPKRIRSTSTKPSTSNEESSMLLSVPSNTTAEETVEGDGSWLQRLANPREPTKVATRSDQSLLPLDKGLLVPKSVALQPTNAIMASRRSSQVTGFHFLTPESPVRGDVASSDVSSQYNWLQRLRSRSQASSGPKGVVPNVTEPNSDDFSYVSTLAPDSDAGSNPDALDVDDSSPESMMKKEHRHCKPRPAKRKREYGSICAVFKPPVEKVCADVFPGLTSSGSRNDDNEVLLLEPSYTERSSMPRMRKKRRALANLSNAMPDAIPSAMVIAKEINAPVWEFKENAWS